MKNRMVLVKWLIGLTLIFIYFFEVHAREDRVEDKFPLELSSDKGTRSDLIIYLTGDGGWNRFSRNLAQEFEKQGYGVVSLNSLKYFREEKSPQDLASDLGLLAEHYLKEWNKTSVIVVGYSFGADVASFLPGRISSQLKGKIKKVALLSPSASTDFIIRIADLLGFSDNETGKFKVLKEIEHSPLPVICIFGETESLLLKKYLKDDEKISVHVLPGGHRYDDNYSELVQVVLS